MIYHNAVPFGDPKLVQEANGLIRDWITAHAGTTDIGPAGRCAGDRDPGNGNARI